MTDLWSDCQDEQIVTGDCFEPDEEIDPEEWDDDTNWGDEEL